MRRYSDGEEIHCSAMGTAVNFMVTEPLASWGKVNVRHTRTAVDLARELNHYQMNPVGCGR